MSEGWQHALVRGLRWGGEGSAWKGEGVRKCVGVGGRP